jgi:hypothetical protein
MGFESWIKGVFFQEGQYTGELSVNVGGFFNQLGGASEKLFF